MPDKQKTIPHDEHAEVTESQWAAAFRHVKENPLMYAGAILFILAVYGFSWYYRAQSRMSNEAEVAELARALDEEDRSVRLTLFEVLAERDTEVQPEALYMLGETAFELEKHDVAIGAFSRLKDEFPDFYLTPDAVEGLGFTYEAQEKFAEAQKEYKNVQSSWPDSFASRRQPLNIGRVLLASGDTEGAIAAFREQQTTFAGSRASANAEEELNKLRTKQPELFAVETADVDLEAGALLPTVDVSPADIGLDITSEN